MDCDLCKSESEINNFPDTWIPFKDYLYSIKDNVIHEYKPDYRVINVIPYEYMKVCLATDGEELESFF